MLSYPRSNPPIYLSPTGSLVIFLAVLTSKVECLLDEEGKPVIDRLRTNKNLELIGGEFDLHVQAIRNNQKFHLSKFEAPQRVKSRPTGGITNSNTSTSRYILNTNSQSK